MWALVIALGVGAGLFFLSQNSKASGVSQLPPNLAFDVRQSLVQASGTGNSLPLFAIAQRLNAESYEDLALRLMSWGDAMNSANENVRFQFRQSTTADLGVVTTTGNPPSVRDSYLMKLADMLPQLVGGQGARTTIGFAPLQDLAKATYAAIVTQNRVDKQNPAIAA